MSKYNITYDSVTKEYEYRGYKYKIHADSNDTEVYVYAELFIKSKRTILCGSQQEVFDRVDDLLK